MSSFLVVYHFFSHVVDRHTTGLTESLVVKACLAYIKEVPIVAVELLVDIYYVKTFVLHRLSVLVF